MLKLCAREHTAAAPPAAAAGDGRHREPAVYEGRRTALVKENEVTSRFLAFRKDFHDFALDFS
jgi:hypothetical protein